MSTTPPPPPGAPPPPPSPAPAPGGSSGVALGPGQIVALIGGALVLISGWLNWFDIEGSTASAYKIGSEILFDSSFEEGKGLLGVGYLVFLCAALIVVGTFLKQVNFLTFVGGGLAVVIGLLFVFQINNFLGNVEDEFGQTVDLFDFITYFPFLTVAGGAAAILGGVLALQQK